MVDLGRVGAKVLLVRLHGAGERERQQRAAVEAAPEADHRRPPGVRPRDLDCVLDRLGPGAEEDGLLRSVARGELRQSLSQPQVALVHDDLK